MKKPVQEKVESSFSVGVTLPTKHVQLLERLAHRQGVTINQFVNLAVAEKLAAMKGAK